MIAPEDDEPNDPRHFRRTLVPLDIEDADKPPSLARRIGRLFRKKNADRDLPPEPEKDTPPPEGGDGGEVPDQDL